MDAAMKTQQTAPRIHRDHLAGVESGARVDDEAAERLVRREIAVVLMEPLISTISPALTQE
tara:strand:+ start:1026 stop:1208 length:183 start_codon:yes stop_codon:yes gene_type:complete